MPLFRTPDGSWRFNQQCHALHMSINTSPHACFSAPQRTTHSHWHECRLFSAAQQLTQVCQTECDRTQFCSTVPLKSHWCAFHTLQGRNTPSSRSSQQRTQRTSNTPPLRAKRCPTLLCNRFHIVWCVNVISAHVHHSAARGQSGFHARIARSTSCEPNVGPVESVRHFYAECGRRRWRLDGNWKFLSSDEHHLQKVLKIMFFK